MSYNQRDEMHNMLNEIVQENISVNIPLTDLVWTMIVYSYEMRDIEDELFKHYPFRPRSMSLEMEQSLVNDKEYLACRRDELARIISQYSDFDTSKIHDKIKTIFRDYTKQRGQLL